MRSRWSGDVKSIAFTSFRMYECEKLLKLINKRMYSFLPPLASFIIVPKTSSAYSTNQYRIPLPLPKIPSVCKSEQIRIKATNSTDQVYVSLSGRKKEQLVFVLLHQSTLGRIHSKHHVLISPSPTFTTFFSFGDQNTEYTRTELLLSFGEQQHTRTG